MTREELKAYHVEAAAKLRSYADDSGLRESDVKHYTNRAAFHDECVAVIDSSAEELALAVAEKEEKQAFAEMFYQKQLLAETRMKNTERRNAVMRELLERVDYEVSKSISAELYEGIQSVLWPKAAEATK